eukprot:jgi/Chrpa1/7613/Chrysochromulina_OHIO_Genome00003652-RA
MMHRFGAVLGADQFGQLKGWLRSSALETLMLQLPPPPPPPDDTAADVGEQSTTAGHPSSSALAPAFASSATAGAAGAAGSDAMICDAPSSPSRRAPETMAKTEYAPTTTPQKVKPSEERTSSGSASAVMGDSDDGCAGDDGVDCDDDVREDGGSSVRDDSALHPRSKHEQERAAAAFDAELSRQLFFDQLVGSLPQHHWPLHQTFGFDSEAMGVDDDYSHYDTPLGMTPALPRIGASQSLPSHFAAHIATLPVKASEGSASSAPIAGRSAPPSADAEDSINANARTDAGAPGSQRGGGGGGTSGGNGGGNLAVRPSPLTAAYGEGLAVLLSHLAASRPPQVAAWLQLKEEQRAHDEEALEEGGWDDLNELEEAFIHTNTAHLANKSWLIA